MSSSGSLQNVRQIDPLENRLLSNVYVQNSKILGLRWAFPLAHAELSVASFFRSAQVLQTSWLEDFNLQLISFRLCRLKWLKVFSLWISGFRSKKLKWLKFKSMCGTLSVTWCQRTSEIWSLEVFAFLLWFLSFCWDTLLLSLFFWILVLFVYDFYYSIYPLPFWDKKGKYCFYTGFLFLTSQVIFVLEWPKGEFVSFIGYILLTKSLSCKVVTLTGMPYYFRVFKYSEFILLIWKVP
jgi:hypothetical protein